MQYVNYVIDNADTFATPFFVFLWVFLVALGLRRIAYRLMARWARRTTTRIDDEIIKATRGPSLLWCVIVGIQVAVATSPLDLQIISYSHKLLGALIAVSVSLVLANVAVSLVKIYSGQIDLPATGLTSTILKITIVSLGITLALGILGIDITPLVAALGIGGLAVALGLQDTLANLFAGVFVLLSKPVRVGDYVKLESGQEG